MFPGSVVLAMTWKRVTLLPCAAQESRDHFVMLLTPHGRIGGAGRRVAREKQHDPSMLNELCRGQPEVGAVVVVIANVIAKESLQMVLVQTGVSLR